jgi:hypothetical protein
MVPKRKKQLYICLVALIAVVLLVIYFFWESNPNKISGMTHIETYNSHFEKYVKSKYSKPFQECNLNEKQQIIQQIVDGDDKVLKIVASRYLMETSGLNTNKELINKLLFSKINHASIEIINGMKNVAIEFNKDILINFIKSISKNINLNSELPSIDIYGKKGKNLSFQLNEISLKDLDFNNSSVYEINLLFPKDYEYFISFPNFDDNWREFTSTNIVKNFTNIESYIDFKKISFLSDYYNFKQLIDKNVGFLSNKVEPDKIFVDDLKFAKYSSGFLAVTFAEKNIDFFQALIKTLNNESLTGYLVTEEKINDIIITKIAKGSSKTLYFYQIDDYFVISDNKALIEKSITSYKIDNTKSITFDPSFQTDYTRVDLSGKNDFCFIRYNIDNDETNSSLFLLKKAIAELESKNINTKEIIDIKQKYFPSKQNVFPASKFMSEKQIAYYTSNNFNVFSILDNSTNVANSGIISRLEKQLGFKINDFITNNFYKNVFVAYTGIDYISYSKYSIPKICLVFGMKEKNINNIISTIQKSIKIKPIKETYKKNDIYIFNKNGARIALDETDPNKFNYDEFLFSFIDNYMFVSMSEKSIKELIDTYLNKRENVTEEKIIPNFELDVTTFLDDYYKFTMRYASMISSFNQGEVETKIKPFFDILKDFKSIRYTNKEENYSYKADFDIMMER